MNNPVRFTDPSGHDSEDSGVIKNGEDFWIRWLTDIAGWFGVTFEGKPSLYEIRDALYAIIGVGEALAKAIGGGITPWDAFKKVYGYIKLIKGSPPDGTYCKSTWNGKGMCTEDSHHIYFGEIASPGGNRTDTMAFIEVRNNFVHELGHAFADNWWYKDPVTGEYKYRQGGPLGLNQIPSSLLNESIFYPSPNSADETWRQHPGNWTASEIFADMFLGWVYGTWANDFDWSSLQTEPNRTTYVQYLDDIAQDPTFITNQIAVANERDKFMYDHMKDWITNNGSS